MLIFISLDKEKNKKSPEETTITSTKNADKLLLS